MIETLGLSFAWPGQSPLFSDLTLTLQPGQVTAVVGPNGMGKSTFLRLIAGLERPLSGQIRIAGFDTAEAAPGDLARRIGAVMQASDRHFLRSTVLDEVALGPRALGLSDPEAQALATLKRLGLHGHATSHPLDLDAGARRLVSLASALVHRPKVVLLDEAQRGLDRINRRRLEAAIATEAAGGATVVIVSHDSDFLARTASQTLRFSRDGVVAV